MPVKIEEVESIDCEKEFGKKIYSCKLNTKNGESRHQMAIEIITNGADGMAVNTIHGRDTVHVWLHQDSDNTLTCNLEHSIIECESKSILEQL